jgi:hypothetical protein
MVLRLPMIGGQRLAGWLDWWYAWKPEVRPGNSAQITDAVTQALM